MNIHLLPEAEADIEEALDYDLGSAPVEVATALQNEVKRVVALLGQLPRIGRAIGPSIRAFGLSRFPYNIVYTINADALVIVAVAHHRQAPTNWRDRL